MGSGAAAGAAREGKVQRAAISGVVPPADRRNHWLRSHVGHKSNRMSFSGWQWAGLKVSLICDGANLPPEHPSGLPAAGSTRGQGVASSLRWSIHQGLLATRRLHEGRGREGGSPQHVPMPEQHSPSHSRWGWQGQWGSGAEHTPGTGASRQHRGSPASSACNGTASRN